MSKRTNIKVTEKAARALRLAVFSLFMQTGNGIVGKSSGYILDKFKKVMGSQIDVLPDQLDPMNKVKLNQWMEQEGYI